MDPGVNSGKVSGFFDPPVFSPDGDLESWGKRFGQWAESLKAAHDDGTDRTFQTVFKLLGRTIYNRGLPDSQKAIADEPHSKGHVDCLHMEDPVEAALQIAKIVTVNPPISTFTHLISSYRRVTSQ